MVSVKLGKTLYSEVQQLFSSRFGCNTDDIEPLTAHGSDRVILRLRSSGGESAIGIINHNTRENRAFIAFAEHFRTFGLNVPQVFSKNADGFSYLMEDLGDITLLKRISECRLSGLGEQEKKLFHCAIESLPEFQLKAGRSLDYSFCYQFDEFGEENIRFDINYFNNRFLKNFYKGEIDGRRIVKDYDCLTAKLLELERGNFLYRDFQARNIMVKDGDLYFIDFQSGRRGSLLYDIASLIYDARADIPQHNREEYLSHYLDTVSGIEKIDKGFYYDYFWYFAMIRIMQAMGAYGFLGISKGKISFLKSVPAALKNICFIIDNKIDNSNFRYLREIFSEISI